MENIIFELENNIARITFNRPDKLNSFNRQMHQEVLHAINQAKAKGVRALILTGAGRGFCAGQDLSDPAMDPDSKEFDIAHLIEITYNKLIRALKDFPAPTIAAVNGVAAGAGANIALACDSVIAANSASFIQAFAKIGLIPDSGGTWSLPRLVGQARAMGLAMLGDKLSASQAQEWGMIWKAVDDAAFKAEVDKLAAHLAVQATQALYNIRKSMDAAHLHNMDQQLDMERDLQAKIAKGHDYREGVAAFIGKRAPSFKGQ